MKSNAADDSNRSHAEYESTDYMYRSRNFLKKRLAIQRWQPAKGTDSQDNFYSVSKKKQALWLNWVPTLRTLVRPDAWIPLAAKLFSFQGESTAKRRKLSQAPLCRY